MKAYTTHFDTLDENWHWSYPWGTPKNEQGEIKEYCLGVDIDGLVMNVKRLVAIPTTYYLPRIFWTGAPFGYGLFEAEITVPFQDAVPDFVLYSKAKYKLGVRSILPEIDIAEFGTKNHPHAINMAVHRWERKPKFLKSVKYYTCERHELDYVGHKQTSKLFAYESLDLNDVRRKYQCEVTKNAVKIYINGNKCFHKRIRLEACFTPTFGISVPDWIKNPDPKWMIVHNFSVEQ